MGRVKGSGEGAGREKRKRRIFFLPSPSPLSFFRPRTYRKGYYFYSPQSSTVIKSKMAATTILRTGTMFRPPIKLSSLLQWSHIPHSCLSVFLIFHYQFYSVQEIPPSKCSCTKTAAGTAPRAKLGRPSTVSAVVTEALETTLSSETLTGILKNTGPPIP